MAAADAAAAAAPAAAEPIVAASVLISSCQGWKIKTQAEAKFEATPSPIKSCGFVFQYFEKIILKNNGQTKNKIIFQDSCRNMFEQNH